jgi:phosphate transport system permease protein
VSSILRADEAHLHASAPDSRPGENSIPPPASHARRAAVIDRLFGWTARLAALLTLALLAGILLSLQVGPWPAIQYFGLDFFTSTVLDP